MLFFRLSFLKQVKLELIWKHILASAFLLEKQNHQLQIGPKKNKRIPLKASRKTKKVKRQKNNNKTKRNFFGFQRFFCSKDSLNKF